MRRYALLFLAALTPSTASAQAPPPAPAAPAPENLARFDYTRAEVRRQDDRWQLVADGRPLKDFGRNEAEARKALRLVQDLRLTQHGTVGTPRPVIEYWLADGRAPRAVFGGRHLTSLDPRSVRAERVRDQWSVRDDKQVLFQFGAHEEDARRAAEVIRRYEFNQVGFVGPGQGPPTMMYFLAQQANEDAAQVVRLTPAPKPPAANQAGKPAPANPLAGVLQPPGRQLANPAGAARTDRVLFDWRAVQVKRENNDWKLVSGGLTLAHFGRSERDAKQALAVMQRYRFTELCQAGGPQSGCTYYLVNGQAPQGKHLGVSGVAFRPEALTVQERNGDFRIIDGTRVVMHFGANEPEARQVLQVIQQHKFDHWCHVGRPGQGGMTFFVRGR